MTVAATISSHLTHHLSGDNLWLRVRSENGPFSLASPHPQKYEVLESEHAVGLAMFDELEATARAKDGDVVVVLLGGRGGQALHRHLKVMSESGEADTLLKRLRVFTQDALAPLRMDNGLSFVRDFERLLGEAFFRKINSFTPMRTDVGDLESELTRYSDELRRAGGIDILFLGHGPEANSASHLCYIRPGSGATARDVAGLIPVSSGILDHHIAKFKAGGSTVGAADEAECRGATHIMTLGPAAILGARRIVQSIVDASTAPAKRSSFRRVVETKFASSESEIAAQLNENPGLWVRLHPNVRTLVLPDLLEAGGSN
jgi:6-phosphogluconolactonase/glucosamine-6-phosphate isomerase/deaminase